MARENLEGQAVSSFDTPNLKSIGHFNEFEKIALKGVLATSKDILEYAKFALIFNSQVTPKMQKETLAALKKYRAKQKIVSNTDSENNI